MHSETAHRKVTASHLQRDAYLYIRQSSMGQVLNNQESARLQYELRGQAIALGWAEEQIRIVDDDQGESAAVKGSRDGFQELVVDVSLQRAGIVMGREVSRLARNSSDWHRLLEICGFTHTLVLDQDGLYDLDDFNDRLLLGLKGVMSEAELHILRGRLLEGLRSKAKRGELKTTLPTGLAYDPLDRVVLEPDKQVRDLFKTFFETFGRIGTTQGTVRHFRRQGIKFPRRGNTGPRPGPLLWGQLTQSLALQILHNPQYAGAFCFGRTRSVILPDGRKTSITLPRDQWQVLIRDKHQGYITWEQYEENLRRLRQNATAHGQDRRRSPPREGPSLLQGLAICGVCGKRMTVAYHKRNHKEKPDYLCQQVGIEEARTRCQQIAGATIDKAIADLLLEMINPLNLQLALSVQAELESRLEEADHLRRQQVDRARYEADLVKRRYMQTDPDNRLVADVLEADWNEKLRLLADAQAQYERQRETDRKLLTDEQRNTIMALTSDFPKLWNAPTTSHRDRKRIVRLLIEDVTIIRDAGITLHVRFRGGAIRTLELPPPLSGLITNQTDAAVVARIDQLLDEHTNGQTAEILNREQQRTAMGHTFTALAVRVVCRGNGLASRRQRLIKRGFVPPREVAKTLGVQIAAVANWRRKGVLLAEPADDNGHFMYQLPAKQIRNDIRQRQKCRSRRTAKPKKEKA